MRRTVVQREANLVDAKEAQQYIEQIQQAMKDPEVSSLSEQGDAAMAAAAKDNAFDLY